MKGRVNGKVVYLDEGQLPRLTFSINDLVDPSKVSGTRSTSFKILNTPEAAQAMGSEAMAEVLPGRMELVLEDGGVDLFRSDVVPLQRNRNNIDCVTVGGNAAWMEWAKKTKLADIDHGVFNVTKAAMITSWGNTYPLHFPLIDYGSFFNRANTHDVDPVKLRPAIRCEATLETAFATINFTINPRGTLKDLWPKFIVAGPTKKLRSITPGIGYGNVATCSDFQAQDPSSFQNYTIKRTGFGTPNNMNFLAGWNFTKGDDGLLRASLNRFPIYLQAGGPYAGLIFRYHLWDNTDNIELTHVDRTPTAVADLLYNGGEYFFHTAAFPPVYVPDAHAVSVRITCLQAQQTAIIVLPSDEGGSNTVIRWREETDYALGLDMVVASAMPSWTVMQLLQSVLGTAQCLVFDTNEDTRTVNVWTYADKFGVPYTETATRDWSDRSDHTNPPERNTPLRPSRLTLQWTEDSADALVEQINRVLGQDYGSKTELVTNGSGPEVVQTVLASPTAMVKTFGGLIIPAMHKEESATFQADEYGFKPRLLIADGTQAGTWTLDGDTMTYFPRVYFVSRDRTSLAFGNGGFYQGAEYNETWKKRAEHLISDTLNIALFIHDDELANFDHGKPTLVDDGTSRGWFYVQKIDQHRLLHPSPTRCTLLPCGWGADPQATVNPVPTYVVPPDNPVDPPFEEPLWRTPLVTVRFGFNSLDMEDLEAVFISLPLVYPPDTFNVIVNDHLNAGDADGSTYIRRHTGCVLRWMGAGNGDGGSGWADQNVPVGSIVEVTNDNGPDRIRMVVQQVGSTLYSASGGSGKFSVRYCASIAPLAAPSPSSTTALDVASLYTGVNSNRLSFMDLPRMCKIQYNTVEGNTSSPFWMDAAMPLISEANAYAGFTVNIPNDALFMRAVWYRIDYEQGTGGITNAFD